MNHAATLAATAALCAAAVAHAQDDGAAVASAPDYFPEVLLGPNTGEPALPTPPGPAGLKPELGESQVNAGAAHLSLGLDVTSAYFYRGLRLEDEGVRSGAHD